MRVAKRRQHEGTLGLIRARSFNWLHFSSKIIFRALGITVADFQVAGGLILLGIGGARALDLGAHDRTRAKLLVVPLGMPLIAGPALLTRTLILRYGWNNFTVLALFVNLLLVGFAFRSRHSFCPGWGARYGEGYRN